MEKCERPILFSGPMVKAILSGSKCQTRRVLKMQHPGSPWVDTDIFADAPSTGAACAYWSKGSVANQYYCRCPYGSVKTRLWVRETFDYGVEGIRPVHGVKYRADGEFQYREEAKEKWPSNGKWKPSIFMPRFASRITLEVTDARVERVQDITADDAELEGIKLHDYENSITGEVEQCYSCGDIQGDSPRAVFQVLWDLINGKRNGGKYSWDANPWVWAVTFKRLEVC